MPSWKKVITSGSNAVLNQITASGDVILNGSNKDLTLHNSNQQINLFGSDGIGKHFIGYNSGLFVSSTITLHLKH